MTTILSQKGQIILPGAICEQLHLQAGDDFEVTIEDEDPITLWRVAQPANCGLVDLLLACPASFEIPVREKEGGQGPVSRQPDCRHSKSAFTGSRHAKHR